MYTASVSLAPPTSYHSPTIATATATSLVGDNTLME